MPRKIITILLFIFTIASGRILLYNTKDGLVNRKFDCVHHKSDDGEIIQYCRRLPESETVLHRNGTICQNEGELYSFRQLILQNILPSEVLDWNSSIEMADLYAHVFYNRSSTENSDDQYVCKCMKRGTFGKHCEYQLTHDAEVFSDAIKAQFEQKKNGDSWNTQKYGSILCYETLSCDSGLLCLDWRDINDGIQRCVDGYDEENWDKLEFNECEDNEFRCANGMCIPQEFWLDGRYSTRDIFFSYEIDSFHR